MTWAVAMTCDNCGAVGDCRRYSDEMKGDEMSEKEAPGPDSTSQGKTGATPELQLIHDHYRGVIQQHVDELLNRGERIVELKAEGERLFTQLACERDISASHLRSANRWINKAHKSALVGSDQAASGPSASESLDFVDLPDDAQKILDENRDALYDDFPRPMSCKEAKRK